MGHMSHHRPPNQTNNNKPEFKPKLRLEAPLSLTSHQRPVRPPATAPPATSARTLGALSSEDFPNREINAPPAARDDEPRICCVVSLDDPLTHGWSARDWRERETGEKAGGPAGAHSRRWMKAVA